ncbi:MAG: cysteine--tRNA ligase [Planctomycetota bacterium]|nr:cysteine--tRNA ligase [Planctomycetota bacterium]
MDPSQHNLQVYNTLSRQREKFAPLDPPRVGMYVCGPTVYGDAHIGHAKSYVSFDVIVCYLRYLGYRVTYVQNITDVGHLTDDADEGEDKVERKAKAERVHPMQVAEDYTRRYFEDMDRLNVLRPDISPRASGHIIEQIELVKRLLAAGHAYEAGGSVYFDVASWPKYGRLSGRTVGEMQAGARVEVSAEKRAPADFALWKRAEPGHIMQWPSPWGMGFPGWHLECSAMSMKYLGESFDIHGGGMENQFPHHEDEIAQAEAATGKPFVRYWLHNNMVTVNGQKMGKSLGNFITLRDAFAKWDPMVLRMFILQSHYRSPLDFSDEALLGAVEGYERLARAYKSLTEGVLDSTQGAAEEEAVQAIAAIQTQFDQAMDEDFSTPIALGALFDLARETNRLLQKPRTLGTFAALGLTYIQLGVNVLGLKYGGKTKPTQVSGDKPVKIARTTWAESVLSIDPSQLPQPLRRDIELLRQGILEEKAQEDTGHLGELAPGLIEALVDLRTDARKAKNFAQADAIRKRLDEIGIILEDTPEGTKWRFK